MKMRVPQKIPYAMMVCILAASSASATVASEPGHPVFRPAESNLNGTFAPPSREWAMTPKSPAKAERPAVGFFNHVVASSKLEIPSVTVLVVAPEPPPEIDVVTRRFGVLPYLERKRQMEQAIETGSANSDDFLSYAEYLLSQAMTTEARSFLVSSVALGGDVARIDAYAQVADLLDGRSVSVPETFGWSRGSLWPTVAKMRGGEQVLTSELREAAGSLALHSSAVAGIIAPDFFELAASRRDVRLSRDILSAILQSSDLSQSSQLLYMQGTMAQLDGLEEAAFDYFSLAAKEPSRAGAKASLALVNIALKRGDEKVLAKSRDILADALSWWSGDEVELRLLAKLAEVSEEMRDLPTAVEVMGRISSGFPETSEARLASARLPIMLRAISDKIGRGEMSLEESLVAFRRLEPVSSEQKQWPTLHMTLAERLERNGLHSAAMLEFGRISDGAGPATQDLRMVADLNRIRLMAERDPEAALDRFKTISGQTDPDVEKLRLHVGLKVQDSAVMSDLARLLHTFANDEVVLGEVALASFQHQDYRATVDALNAKSRLVSSLTDDDQLLLARSYSNLNKGLDLEFPPAVQNELYANLGESVVSKISDVRPLSAENAGKIVSEAGRVLKLTQSIGK